MDEELLERTIELLETMQRVSSAILQRKFKINFELAEKLITEGMYIKRKRWLDFLSTIDKDELQIERLNAYQYESKTQKT